MAHSAGLDGWMGGVSGQESSSVPRERHKDGRQGESVRDVLAEHRERDRDHTNGEKARGGQYPAHDARAVVLSGEAVAALTRGNGAHDRVYRARAWDHA